MIDKILNNFKENYNDLGTSYYPEDILGPNDLKPLYDYINKLQSNWNSLREWLISYRTNIENPDFYEEGIVDFIDETLDKMNELEGKDKNE